VRWLAEGLEGYPCAIEIRHRSWLGRSALDYLHSLGLNVCDIDICQTKTSVPPGTWTTGPLGYVRLHGRNAEAWFDKKAPVHAKYDYLYSQRQVEEWARRVREIAAQTEETYVILNNHFGGKAVVNAFQLARLLDVPAPAPPRRLVERFPVLA